MYRLRSPILVFLLVLLAGCGLSFGDFEPLDPGPDPFEREGLNFLVIGDWGRNGWFYQANVARRMGETAEAIDADFVVTTGDNFYENGVESITDKKWRRSFEDVYRARSLHVPWYVTLGNHDYRGSVEAQIRYTAQSDRWTMPSRYYAVEKQVSDSVSALFVFLDTVPLVKGLSTSTERITEEETSVEWQANEQLRWLDSTLTTTTADWRFVFGHHPIYSASANHTDSPRLRARVAPLLERHGVAAYVCGHVHSMQHLEPAGTEVAYFVSGGGSLARTVSKDTAAVFAAGAAGFMAASVQPESMYVQFIDYKGTVGHAAWVRNRLTEDVPPVTTTP